MVARIYIQTKKRYTYTESTMSKSRGARADCKIANIWRKHFQNSEYFQVSRPTLSLFAALYVRVCQFFFSCHLFSTFFNSLFFFFPFRIPSCFSSIALHFAHTLTHTQTDHLQKSPQFLLQFVSGFLQASLSITYSIFIV